MRDRSFEGQDGWISVEPELEERRLTGWIPEVETSREARQ